MITIDITGLDEVLDTIDRIGRAFEKELADGVEAGAEVLRDKAAENAPRGESGDLARNMTYEIERGLGEAKAFVGPGYDEYYGRFRELGTFNQTPHPFLRPALDTELDRIIDAMAEHFEPILRKEGR